MGSAGHRLRFRDRRHAGQRLARALAPRYGGRDDVVVLALPRGGVPVADETRATASTVAAITSSVGGRTRISREGARSTISAMVRGAASAGRVSVDGSAMPIRIQPRRAQTRAR